MFGPYELRTLLGRGGMGAVYEALDTRRDRIVAIKLLPEELAQDPSFQERFRRESQATIRLAEPHIVPVHEWGEIDGVLYLDMRLVHGDDLRTLLHAGPLEPARAVLIVEQVARALDAAHGAGLVHRDVQPANILVAAADFVYLADVGIARTEGEGGLTLVGATLGSYTYMAPERFDVGPVGGSSDIYSLGCVLYECLTGVTPFPAQSVSVLIRSHLSEPPPQPSLRRPDVPAALDAVLARAMAKAPGDRYPTAGEFAAQARAALGLSPTPQSSTGGAVDPNPSGQLTVRQTPPTTFLPPLRQTAPSTFQPFGPQGPTLAAQATPQTRPAAPEPTRIMPVAGPPQPPGDPAAPRTESPARPVPDPAAGPTTTGTLRIIPPAAPDQDRDPSSELPVIHPTDPTRVLPGEFQYTPLPTAPAGIPGRPDVVPDPPPATSAAGHSGTAWYSDQTQIFAVPDHSEQAYDEHRPEERGPEEHSYGERGDDQQSVDTQLYAAHPGVRAFPVVAEGHNDPRYEDAEYASRHHAEPGYSEENYAEENYAEDGYADPNYADQSYADQSYADHGHAEQNHADSDYDEQGYGKQNYDEQGYDDYENDGHEEPQPARRRSLAVPILLGSVIVVAAAVIGVIGWRVMNRSNADHTAVATGPNSTVTMAASPPQQQTPETTTTTTSSDTPPASATICPQLYPAEGGFRTSATGTSVTSCRFAEAVRKAYAQAVSGGSNAGGSSTARSNSEGPATIEATSPVTGRAYTMSCTPSGRLVTCTGGDNALVYLY
jgi:serine/threonine-protein kinase